MGQIIWHIKEALRKLVVVALVGSVAWGGYHLYRKGAFRGGVGHFGKVVARQIPYFGSRFRHFISSGSSSRSSHKAVSYRRYRKGKNRARNGRYYAPARRHSRGRRR